jgi:hypothetical protein
LSTRSSPHPDDIQPSLDGYRVGMRFVLSEHHVKALARRKGVDRISRRQVVALLEAAVFRYLESL